MRDYAKISGRFWTGTTGKKLRGNLEMQVLAMYLMTSTHSNMIGIYHCPIMYMAHETGLSIEGATEALQSLIEAEFCTFDGDEEVVWVHEMAAHQIGTQLSANDKQVIGIRKQYAQIVSDQIRRGFAERYQGDFHLEIDKPLASPSKAPPKPGTGTGTGIKDIRRQPKADLCPHQEIIALYANALPELPQPRIWDGQREKNLTARWRWVLADLKEKGKPCEQSDGLDFFRRMFEYIHASDFLMGRAGTWSADLGWIVKAENFAKIIQGNYENKVAA